MSDTEQLSDEQRISQLEDKVGKNRTVIMIVALTLVVILSVSLTVLILKLMRADEPFVPRSVFEEQKAEVKALRDVVKKQQHVVEDLKLNYKQSQVSVFRNTLVEQEQSYQAYLATMKLGMFDLAKMVQGSRTWLELYKEKLDDGIALSKEREKRLQRLQTD